MIGPARGGGLRGPRPSGGGVLVIAAFRLGIRHRPRRHRGVRQDGDADRVVLRPREGSLSGICPFSGMLVDGGRPPLPPPKLSDEEKERNAFDRVRAIGAAAWTERRRLLADVAGMAGLLKAESEERRPRGAARRLRPRGVQSRPARDPLGRP